MKITKPGKINKIYCYKIKCNNCESEFLTKQKEILDSQDFDWNYIYYIKCPECDKKIILSDQEQGGKIKFSNCPNIIERYY